MESLVASEEHDSFLRHGEASDFTTFMNEAIREARRAEERGEVPVGAVVVAQGAIIGRGHNLSISVSDPTAHAEIMALRDAAAVLRNYRLPDVDIFVTIEPCLMCTGALVHARVRRLIFGARDPKAGSVRSLYRLLDDRRLNHRIEVHEGVLAEECVALLHGFFKSRRGEP